MEVGHANKLTQRVGIIARLTWVFIKVLLPWIWRGTQTIYVSAAVSPHMILMTTYRPTGESADDIPVEDVSTDVIPMIVPKDMPKA